MRAFVQKIHDRAICAVKVYRQGQNDLIQTLQEMDRCHGYRDFHCKSLWQYCLEKLKLDESEASALIGIARKSCDVPELKKAVESGQIHVSNARQIVPVLNRDNKCLWLEKAQTLTKRELQKELASHFPKASTIEKAKFVSAKRVQFQCGLDQKDYKEFLDVQNLVSTSHQRHADFEATLNELVRFYKNAHDPLLKAQRAETRRLKKQQNLTQTKFEGQAEDKSQIEDKTLVKNETLHQAPELVNRTRKYAAGLEHQINLRDQAQCTQVDTKGNRCQERRWLSFHHKIEVKDGGQDTLENLQTLCWAHHQLVHHKTRLSDRHRNYQVTANSKTQSLEIFRRPHCSLRDPGLQ